MLCFVPINNVLLNIYKKNYLFGYCFRTLAAILDLDFGKLCFILINSVFLFVFVFCFMCLDIFKNASSHSCFRFWKAVFYSNKFHMCFVLFIEH